MSGLVPGMTLAPRRVLIEQGPVGAFADVIDAPDDCYRSAKAAAAAGLPGVPVPPTYPFVMWHWGAHRDLQPPAGDADLGDLAEVSALLAAEGGLMLHGEQEFVYHRPLYVGETVDLFASVTEVSEKTRSDGRTMRIAKIVTEVRGSDGELAQTQTTTLICLK